MLRISSKLEMDWQIWPSSAFFFPMICSRMPFWERIWKKEIPTVKTR